MTDSINQCMSELMGGGTSLSEGAKCVTPLSGDVNSP